jgi:hypothetical protein
MGPALRSKDRKYDPVNQYATEDGSLHLSVSFSGRWRDDAGGVPRAAWAVGQLGPNPLPSMLTLQRERKYTLLGFLQATVLQLGVTFMWATGQLPYRQGAGAFLCFTGVLHQVLDPS